MDLILEPELYQPNVDEIGNFIDKIPSIHILKNGIRCPCGSRKEKTYDTHGVFSTHIKTKTHQKWLNNLNLNKANYYIENENLKTTLHNQRLIISKLEKEVQNKSMTIDYLTRQLTNNNNPIDLMNFD
jgi:inner membrane protein involved in colicin E2 resistance